MDNIREAARQIANNSLAKGEPLAWFEELYAKAGSDGVMIPWADLIPNPNLLILFEKIKYLPFGKAALTVGCGYGDDAERLCEQGFEVTAFDISKSAISECNRRFADSQVNYCTQDLFNAPRHWKNMFDLVLESYTLQVLPYKLRLDAIKQICSFVKPHGYLLFIARARSDSEPIGNMPWPLTVEEVECFEKEGFEKVFFEEYMDGETSPVKRFRGCFKKIERMI